MIQETMTPTERMEAAVKLEPVDRIPCAPLMDVLFPSRHKGWTISVGLHNMRKGFHAIVDVFDELGGWDGMILPGFSLPMTPHVYSAVPIGRTINPGIELEKETMCLSFWKGKSLHTLIMRTLSSWDGTDFVSR